MFQFFGTIGYPVMVIVIIGAVVLLVMMASESAAWRNPDTASVTTDQARIPWWQRRRRKPPVMNPQTFVPGSVVEDFPGGMTKRDLTISGLPEGVTARETRHIDGRRLLTFQNQRSGDRGFWGLRTNRIRVASIPLPENLIDPAADPDSFKVRFNRDEVPVNNPRVERIPDSRNLEELLQALNPHTQITQLIPNDELEIAYSVSIESEEELA